MDTVAQCLHGSCCFAIGTAEHHIHRENTRIFLAFLPFTFQGGERNQLTLKFPTGMQATGFLGPRKTQAQGTRQALSILLIDFNCF